MIPKNIVPYGKRSVRGQALIEVLPAILLFIIVIAASLVFFIGIRESFQMQEAARNAAFAKIANSGPLISPASRSSVQGQYEFPIGAGLSNTDVTQANTCFSVTPSSGITTAVLPRILNLNLDLLRAQKMTVFRRPGDPSLCN